MGGRTDQSYTAGSYGYLMAKLSGANDVFVNLDKSPVTQFLSGVGHLKEMPDPSLLLSFRESMQEQNAAVINAMKEYREVKEVIALDSDSMQGSMETMGFYKVQLGGEMVIVLPQFQASFKEKRIPGCPKQECLPE